MTKRESILDIVNSSGSSTRRDFLTKAGAMSAALLGGGMLTASIARGVMPAKLTGRPAYVPPPLNDNDILNFALNLEYLEAEYYQHAAYGHSLPAGLITGVGTQGAVTGGSLVNFTDANIQMFAKEIANDELAHVKVLRSVLGGAAVARPAINIGDAFTTAAVSAGIITAGQTFSPYASDDNFLLGAFIFEDVGVTAYHGAAPLIKNTTVLSYAAGILGTEAYHAGLIRTNLYLRRIATATDVEYADLISALRDKVDGVGADDQGVLTRSGITNIVPADANGITFARTPQEVLSIVYLGGRSGNYGFFPNRLNGTFR